jgi:O-antigen ligase
MIVFYLLMLSLPFVAQSLIERTILGITVEKYLGMACVLYAIYDAIKRGTLPRFFATRQAKLFLAFFIIAAIAQVFPSHALTPESELFRVYISQAVFFCAVQSLMSSQKRLRNTLLATQASLGLASIYLIREWQVAGMSFDYRPGFVTGDANTYSASALVCLPLGFCLALHFRSGWRRYFCVAAIALGLFTLLLGASRGGFIGLLVAAAALVWRSRNRMAITLIAGAALFLLLLSPLSPARRLLSPTRSDQESTQTRATLWTAGLSMIREHPLRGIGLGRYSTAAFEATGIRHVAHNTYIEIAAETGIPGLICFVCMIAASVRTLGKTIETAKARRLHFLYQASRGMQAGMVAFCVAAFFLSGEYFKLFWCMLFISMCMPRIVRGAAAAKRRRALARRNRPDSVQLCPVRPVGSAVIEIDPS